MPVLFNIRKVGDPVALQFRIENLMPFLQAMNITNADGHFSKEEIKKYCVGVHRQTGAVLQ
jgi:hypothetical protein